AQMVLPKWFNTCMAVLTGLLFISVSYFNKYGLLVFLLYICPILIHYKKSGVWPRFLTPAKHILSEGVDEIKSHPIVNAISISLMILTPFIFIKSQDMRLDGYPYTPIIFGFLISLLLYVTAETSRNHYLKKYA